MANNPKVKGIKYGKLSSYLQQEIDADTLYFITDKGLLYRGHEIVVPTKVIDIAPGTDNGNAYYTFTVEAYADDPAHPETLTFDVWSRTAVSTIIQTLQLALTNHTNATASDTVKGHTYLSDATDSNLNAATGGTAATPLAVKNALAAANAYTDEQIANLSQGMRIIGTYGLVADNPDESSPLNEIDATEGDTYICISTMTGVAYVNASGIAVSNASLNPGDYIICVQGAVASQGTVTTPARWTIVANTNSNVVTTSQTLTADTVVLGNGNKTVKKLAAGTTGQFLRQTSNGARWQDHINLEHGIAYGVCETMAGARDLEVSIPGIILQPYAIVAVMFASGVFEEATLNVTETGAMPIIYHNGPIQPGIIDKGDTATFMFVPDFDFKETQIRAWVLISIDRAPNNTPSNLSAFTNDIQALLVCTTAGGTNAKTITNSAVTIKAGSVFAVRFNNAVGAGSTLNINNGGAKPIKHRNANITAYQIRATDTATFIYDGTAYHLLSVDRAIDTAPTAGSHSLVDSDAIYQAIQTAVTDATLFWEEMQ